MGKKPASQTSDFPNGDSTDDIDLTGDLTDDESLNGEDNEDNEDEDDDGLVLGGGKAESKKDISAVLDDFSEKLMGRVTSEIDRRINGALNKRNRKTGDDDQDDKQKGAPVVADVRSARLSFREAVTEEIRFISPEERQFGVEYGRLLIAAEAAKGFEDPDLVGEAAAVKVAEKLKELRKYYSNRTRAVLKQQGALKEQKDGQSNDGGTSTVIGKTKGSEMAASIREQLQGR